MNSTYSCLGNSKVIVTNEDGKQRFVENYDNINDILIEENLIESIEKKVSELEVKKEKYEKINKRKYIPIMMLISLFLTKIVLPFILNTFNINDLTILNSAFQLEEMSFFISSTFIPLAVGIDITIFIRHRQNLKKQNGINSELLYLNKRLKNERRIMKNLLRKSKCLEESKRTCNVSVKSSDKINDLNRYLDFYYNIGYNVDKYYNYYLKGNVNCIAKNKYTEEDANLVNEYFEEQGPVLVKRKLKR